MPQEIKAGRIDCNLAGYAMGNSWISPVDSTITWGPFVYWMVGGRVGWCMVGDRVEWWRLVDGGFNDGCLMMGRW